jgi:hypothetical protein
MYVRSLSLEFALQPLKAPQPSNSGGLLNPATSPRIVLRTRRWGLRGQKRPTTQRITLALLVLGSLLASPAIAEPETRTAKLGNVQAEFSSEPTEYCLTNLRLKIIRAGKTLLVAVPPQSDQNTPCRLADLQVVRLEKQPEPQVVLDLFTGGAHCCTYSSIYQFDPKSQTYTSFQHFWGNRGNRLADLNQDGVMEFVSADDRFAYSFASYAASPSPIQLWAYQPGKLVDITRQHPKLIYADASNLWQAFQENRQDCNPKSWGSCGEGVLAAYLADKYLLGQAADGWKRVRSVYQGNGCDFKDKCLGRESYFRNLEAFLKQQGYAR